MKNFLRVIFSLALCYVLLATPFMAEAAEKITPSIKNYGVELRGAKNFYLHNKEAVDLKVGSKFFLTYTVTEIESDGSGQSGVIITRDPKDEFPYRQGKMKYLQKQALLTEGRTYFFRFEMTKEGLVSTVGWAKGDESDYIGFSLEEGKIQDNCKYFGVWFGDGDNTNMVGRLTRVRCYDENGKDLGIDIGAYEEVATTYDPAERMALVPNPSIQNKYSFSLKDAFNVAISNRKITDSKVVYMEYTVKSVSHDGLWQSGMIHNSTPTNEYPSGFWRNEEHDTENYKGCRLLKPGVTYLIKYELTDQGMDVLLKYKENGEYVYFEYPRCWGESDPGCEFFTLWLGEGRESKVSAEFVDFKCYDDKGNNLGLQTNQGVEITHQGGLEDYSQCIAAYYNEEMNRIIWLQEKNKVSIVTEKEDTEVVDGSYVIDKGVLKTTIGETTTEYKYRYAHVEDTDGNRYIRLKNQKVKFVSGIVSGEEIATVTTSADSGYRVTLPTPPSMEGNTFVSWCYSDGTEFNFEKPVVESITLYAKWQDGDGNEFLAVDAETKGLDLTWYIIGGSCMLIIAATVVGGVLIVRKWKPKKKGDSSNES